MAPTYMELTEVSIHVWLEREIYYVFIHFSSFIVLHFDLGVTRIKSMVSCTLIK